MMQRPFLTKIIRVIILVLLLLPMLILNVRGSHFWSEDFARNLQQAVNICQGKAFDATAYKYIPNFGSLVPLAPVGFSLLLAPMVKISGLNMYSLSFYMSLLFIAWMLVSYVFFRRYFGVNTCLIILFTAFFPNFMIWFKLQIIPDVPFCILFLSACLLLSGNNLNRKTFLWAGLLAGLSTIFSYAGLILFPVIWLYFGVPAFRSKNKELFGWLGLFSLSALLVYGLFNWILFKPQHSYIAETLAAYDIKSLPANFWENVQRWCAGYLDLFSSTDLDIKPFSIAFSLTIAALTIHGFFLKMMKKADLFDLALAFYLFFILVFGVFSDYRLILPVHVIFISYLFYSLRFIGPKLKSGNTIILQLAFTALILFVYIDHLSYIWRREADMLPGPYEAIAKETFDYLQKNVAGNDLMVFNKPETLTLFTGKATVMNNARATARENYKRFHEMGVRYYLYDWMLTDNNYGEFMKKEVSVLKPIYQNWQFTLYEDTTLTTVVPPVNR